MVWTWDFVGHAQKAEIFKAGSNGSLMVAMAALTAWRNSRDIRRF